VTIDYEVKSTPPIRIALHNFSSVEFRGGWAMLLQNATLLFYLQLK